MDNSLITTELIQEYAMDVLGPMLRESQRREAALKEYLAVTGASPDDVMVEQRGFGHLAKWKFRLITAEERWLNWHSANHGWERSESDD